MTPISVFPTQYIKEKKKIENNPIYFPGFENVDISNNAKIKFDDLVYFPYLNEISSRSDCDIWVYYDKNKRSRV